MLQWLVWYELACITWTLLVIARIKRLKDPMCPGPEGVLQLLAWLVFCPVVVPLSFVVFGWQQFSHWRRMRRVRKAVSAILHGDSHPIRLMKDLQARLEQDADKEAQRDPVESEAKADKAVG